MKVPSWVNFFILSTHPQEKELASLPPLNLLVDTEYTDDPSRVVTTYHADWWNSPSGAVTVPAAYSEEEREAFHDWWKLANQVSFSSHNIIHVHQI